MQEPSLTSAGYPSPTWPTIFHVTHWKAGSQWIYRILLDCCADRIVPPELENAQFLKKPIESGKVYPTVYVTRDEYFSVDLPEHSYRFVVIRDLRDTLVSAYFSIRFSHPTISPYLEEQRNILNSISFEDGLLYLMDEFLPGCAAIVSSWVDSGERVIRYEDLLERDVQILESVLLDKCHLPVSRERLREAVEANRFERITGGRPRGQEDVMAHERKAVPGDWKTYFTPRVTEAFKERYGIVLVTSGYER
ncbi:hypothetical protein EG19_07760, partial [Thermoanaerobaculum aquaticum]